MRYYLIAGEASGDLHGSKLIQALKASDVEAEFRCWGGDAMQAAGATLVKHYRELDYMGFTEIVKHLPEIKRNLKFCKKDLKDYRPDVVIFIDYPGFNLRIASFAKKSGFKTAYYISPQIWAWNERRIKRIKKSVDKMLVILPFEKEFYNNHKVDVTYVGHPLTEIIGEELSKPIDWLYNQPVIALLPGSRLQEIKQKLPVMLQVTRKFPKKLFVVAGTPSIEKDYYKRLMSDYPEVKLVQGQTYNLLKQAEAAIVTSGTATLETALFGVPEIVCYKSSFLSYQIARSLIKVRFISLVNLILDKPVVKELIQENFNVINLERELHFLLNDLGKSERMQNEYTKLWRLLGGAGGFNLAAQEIHELASAQTEMED